MELNPQYSLKIVEQDRRRVVRVKTNINGKILMPDRKEYPCNTIDISCKGALIRTTAKAQIKQNIILYLENINQVQAVVYRVYPQQQIALHFVASQKKRENIVDKLTWIINQKTFKNLEDRKHKRHVLHNVTSMFAISPEHAYDCAIIDLSLSGALVVSEQKPPVGNQVKLGQTIGKVVRYTKTGFTIEFDELISDLDDVLPD